MLGEVETEWVVVAFGFVLGPLVGLGGGGRAQVDCGGGGGSNGGICSIRGFGARVESASWWSVVGMNTSGGKMGDISIPLRRDGKRTVKLSCKT